MSDWNSETKRLQYRLLPSLKKTGLCQITLYEKWRQYINWVAKTNELTDNEKDQCVKYAQKQMVACKAKLEQLELLSIGGKGYGSTSETVH